MSYTKEYPSIWDFRKKFENISKNRQRILDTLKIEMFESKINCLTPTHCQPILDFQKFIFLTPHKVDLRGVIHFANISAKNEFLREIILTCLSGAQMQGWEFAGRFSKRIASFLPKNERMSNSLKKTSYSLIRSFLVSNLSDSLTIAHFL